MFPQITNPTDKERTTSLTEDLDFLLEFAKQVRHFAGGHSRGGLGHLHQTAGEAIHRITARKELIPPLQPELVLETEAT